MLFSSTRSLLLPILALGLLSTACSDTRAPIYDNPPIILVNLDTLGADHLGCYGYERDTSPQIDRFAEEAALFEWVFSQGPNTPPSQTSILTGLYPTTHGRIRNHHKLSEGVETLAERLQQAGYRTAAFVDGGLMAAGFGLEQGFQLYDDEAGGVKKIGPKAERWIDAHLNGAETADQPFFLMLHTYDVHSPYELTPWKYRHFFTGELGQEPTPGFRKKMSGTMGWIFKSRDQRPYPQLQENDLRWAEALYDGGIRHVDDWFGKLRTFLEARNLFDQAIVVIISDHGDTFQEHGDLFHKQIYSPVTRIPMIIRFPEGHLAGVYPPVVESIDLMPTLLARVGVESPPNIQGQNLLPYLEGKADRTTLDGAAFTESPFNGRRIAFATETHRLFVTGNQSGGELFQYREDPLEQHDLSSVDPATVERLHRIVRAWEEQATAAQIAAGSVGEVDDATMEQLVLLGYVEEGESLHEEATALSAEFFRDGFESGDTRAWTREGRGSGSER